MKQQEISISADSTGRNGYTQPLLAACMLEPPILKAAGLQQLQHSTIDLWESEFYKAEANWS